jgi:DNA-binding NarL/FixJ family response regulator
MSIFQDSDELPDNFPIPLRTLVVDDSAVLLENLCAYLKAKPLFQIFGTAADGSEAVRTAELHEPDLVLMDLNMPVMDGLQATAILRQRLPNVRIIIMTLDPSAQAKAKARAHGAHGFIGKQAIMNDHLLMTEIRRAFHPKHTKDQRSSL